MLRMPPAPASPPLKTPGPIDTAPLFPGLHVELMALLRGLSPDDWTRPTVAPAWRVRDVASHLLDTSLRRLSMGRDGHRAPPPAEPIDSYASLVRFINQLNADWLQATARLSPRLLVDLLGVVQPQVAAFFATLDPLAPAPISVAWAGESTSANWFDVGREYTEWWHHQAQIRDAVGAPPLNARGWLHPFLDISVRGLPHAYREVDAPAGTTLALRITGDAGGSWCLRRESDTGPASAGPVASSQIATDAGRTAGSTADADGSPTQRGGASRWTLLEGEAPEADARVELEADAAWRLLFNALPAGAAQRQLRVEGDAGLAAPLLQARSVMV
jgi:uncharacterized protein (TIGR03083 family)